MSASPVQQNSTLPESEEELEAILATLQSEQQACEQQNLALEASLTAREQELAALSKELAAVGNPTTSASIDEKMAEIKNGLDVKTATEAALQASVEAKKGLLSDLEETRVATMVRTAALSADLTAADAARETALADLFKMRHPQRLLSDIESLSATRSLQHRRVGQLSSNHVALSRHVEAAADVLSAAEVQISAIRSANNQLAKGNNELRATIMQG